MNKNMFFNNVSILTSHIVNRVDITMYKQKLCGFLEGKKPGNQSACEQDSDLGERATSNVSSQGSLWVAGVRSRVKAGERGFWV